jgi:hypothetical protein
MRLNGFADAARSANIYRHVFGFEVGDAGGAIEAISGSNPARQGQSCAHAVPRDR